jgi:hypothetical protein
MEFVEINMEIEGKNDEKLEGKTQGNFYSGNNLIFKSKNGKFKSSFIFVTVPLLWHSEAFQRVLNFL